MLINNEKTIIEINTPVEGYHLVDETTNEGQELAQKITENYPYFDFVLDGNGDGDLIDIIPTDRPEPEPIIHEPDLEDFLLDLDFRLSSIELGL